MQGTRPGLPMATAWAVMHHLGIDGYRRLTAVTIETANRMRDGVRAIDGLAGARRTRTRTFSPSPPTPDCEDQVDAFAVGDAMQQRGWFHDRQAPPDSLHATVSAGNAPVIEEYLADLASVRHRVRRRACRRPLHELRHPRVADHPALTRARDRALDLLIRRPAASRVAM